MDYRSESDLNNAITTRMATYNEARRMVSTSGIDAQNRQAYAMAAIADALVLQALAALRPPHPNLTKD